MCEVRDDDLSDDGRMDERHRRSYVPASTRSTTDVPSPFGGVQKPSLPFDIFGIHSASTLLID